MKRSPEDTASRAAASRIAGAKGRTASPVPAEQRRNALHGPVTPAQRRRAVKKINSQRARAARNGSPR